MYKVWWSKLFLETFENLQRYFPFSFDFVLSGTYFETTYSTQHTENIIFNTYDIIMYTYVRYRICYEMLWNVHYVGCRDLDYWIHFNIWCISYISIGSKIILNIHTLQDKSYSIYCRYKLSNWSWLSGEGSSTALELSCSKAGQQSLFSLWLSL